MSDVDEFAKRPAESSAWQDLLQRVSDLERQVASLRGAPPTMAAGHASAECPMCGSDQYHRAAKADAAHGLMSDHWVCGECDHQEDQPPDTMHG